ncbi:MAG: urease accessory UreF family protein, partial [Myxococcales bacterium]
TQADGMALLRLLQLASPALPVGAFAYSQGLEAAVAAGLVTDEATASAWMHGLLNGPLTTIDLAIFARLHVAFSAGEVESASRWSAFLWASRATAELQAEDRHLGAALARVLVTLGVADPIDSPGSTTPRTFAQMFALATATWRIDLGAATQAFAFTWAEAQTSAAVRLVPLGQSAGVRILSALAHEIPGAVDTALAVDDRDLGGAAPLQALLSSAHETQYSRLFRS